MYRYTVGSPETGIMIDVVSREQTASILSEQQVDFNHLSSNGSLTEQNGIYHPTWCCARADSSLGKPPRASADSDPVAYHHQRCRSPHHNARHSLARLMLHAGETE